MCLCAYVRGEEMGGVYRTGGDRDCGFLKMLRGAKNPSKGILCALSTGNSLCI